MNTHSSPLLAALCAAFLLITVNTVSADQPASSGTFKGASKHVTTGGVTIVKTANGGMSVVLGQNFDFDGAPDPRVGFGTNGRYDDASDLGKLVKNEGEQRYVVPAGVDVSKYNEVYIWCRKYSVPLGVAALK
jgi:hypothetical protein